jgi:hypothetical protein
MTYKAPGEQFYDQISSEPLDVNEWLAIRKEAGASIDPERAEVCWSYAQVIDPYGVLPEIPDEAWCVGREYFARATGSDVWVNFADIPEEVRDQLWNKQERVLGFPAGLREVLAQHQEELDDVAFGSFRTIQ